MSGAGPGDEVVALDLGGTHLRAARVHPDGTLGRRVRARTAHTDRPDQLVEILSDLAAGGVVRAAVLGLPVGHPTFVHERLTVFPFDGVT